MIGNKTCFWVSGGVWVTLVTLYLYLRAFICRAKRGKEEKRSYVVGTSLHWKRYYDACMSFSGLRRFIMYFFIKIHHLRRNSQHIFEENTLHARKFQLGKNMECGRHVYFTIKFHLRPRPDLKRSTRTERERSIKAPPKYLSIGWHLSSIYSITLRYFARIFHLLDGHSFLTKYLLTLESLLVKLNVVIIHISWSINLMFSNFYDKWFNI